MILSDGEIRREIEAGRICFDPPLDPDRLSLALTTSALDLRLGGELQLYKELEEVAPLGLADPAVIDPTGPGVIPDLVSKWARAETIDEVRGFDLDLRQFVLGATEERIHLPEEGAIAARVEGKSGLARLGLAVHMTAPVIHCGFRGNIVLEMVNFGPYPIRLRKGMQICQLVFERLGEGPTTAQATQFQDQTGAAG